MASRSSPWQAWISPARRCGSTGAASRFLTCVRVPTPPPGLRRVCAADPANQRPFAVDHLGFEFGQSDLGFFTGFAHEAEHYMAGYYSVVVEETLVDVADLFNIDVAVRQAAGVRAALARSETEHQQSVENGQHVKVGDSDRCTGGCPPSAGSGAAFQEREPVGVEKAPPVGGHRQFVVVDTAMQGPAGS